MNELTVTVTGWVATEPKMHVGPSGVRLAAFRLASTPRYFDKKTNKWTDGQTEWFSVRVFRNASITVQKSLAKGQPVIVHGRVKTHEWESDTGQRSEFQLDAITVGHDLTLGTAEFVRAIGDPSLGEDEPEPAEADIPPEDAAEVDDDGEGGQAPEATSEEDVPRHDEAVSV